MWDAITQGLSDGLQTYATMAKIAGLLLSDALMSWW
jgi:hypothetical protein